MLTSNIKKHIHFGSIDKQSSEIHSNHFDGEKKKLTVNFAVDQFDIDPSIISATRSFIS